MSDEKKESVPDIFSESGRTGLKSAAGIIYEEELRALKSYDKRHQTYRQMAENDSVIGAVLYAIEMVIRQADWRVQAASDTPADEEAKVFLEEIMDDMSDSWEDAVAEIVNGLLVHGYSYHELVYKYRNGSSKEPSKRSKFNDGQIGWRKIAIRGQESLSKWIFDEDGGISGMEQIAPPDYQTYIIPIEKALLFRTTLRKGNPEGISLLRKSYRSWYLKQKTETYEAIGIERDLAGLPIIYVPPTWADSNASAGLKAAYANMKKIATDIKRDEQEGVVLPSIFDDKGNKLLSLELLTSGGRRNFDTTQIINRYDQRIAMSMLAQFLLLGSDSVGSFALASSHTTLFANAVGVLLNIVANTINRHAIPRLFELNGKTLESLPKFVPSDIETPDLAELGEYVSKLAGVGITFTNDNELENYLREAANLPLKPEDDTSEEEEPLETKAQVADQEEKLVEAVKQMQMQIQKAIKDEQ